MRRFHLHDYSHEAAKHLGAALDLLDKNPNCASDDQVADFLVSYALLSHLTIQVKVMIGTLERHLPRVDRLGDDPRAVLIRHQYVFALLWSTRYREGAAMQRELSSGGAPWRQQVKGICVGGRDTCLDAGGAQAAQRI